MAEFASTEIGASTGAARDDQSGFTLIEVVIALLVLALMALGVAQMFGIAIQSASVARYSTSTTVLAAQKMEQLRALTWGFDETGLGLPVSDTSTDLTVEPAGDGGSGLNPSPAGSLNANTPGYVDYLDKRGQWVGTGATPPAQAVYIRRWSIEPLPTNPNNTLILQVLVTTVKRETQVAAANNNGARQRHAEDALIATVKTRKAR